MALKLDDGLPTVVAHLQGLPHHAGIPDVFGLMLKRYVMYKPVKEKKCLNSIDNYLLQNKQIYLM